MMIEKNIARKRMIERRNKLSEDEIKYFSRNIAANAYSFIKNNFFKNAAIYMSVKNEVRIEYIIKLDISKSINFYLPQYSRGDYMCFNKFENINSMKTDDYGILCPKGSCIIDIKEIDVFFVPGVAFDISGNRAGYGKGCYDKALNQAKDSLFVGVCYGFQLISDDELEFDGNDIKMHYMLTENGFVEANN